MNRRRFGEVHDYDWFPGVWRRGMTDFPACFATCFFQYEPALPRIAGMRHRLPD
ncbi:MAG: hypothetical protein WCI51_06205 [Lentisphaerota bacterium]